MNAGIGVDTFKVKSFKLYFIVTDITLPNYE